VHHLSGVGIPLKINCIHKYSNTKIHTNFTPVLNLQTGFLLTMCEIYSNLIQFRPFLKGRTSHDDTGKIRNTLKFNYLN
jgi:hypothetical protein